MELERAILVALERGPWPRDELLALLMEAFGCKTRTVEAAAKTLRSTGELASVSYTYWYSPCVWNANAASGYLGGFEREKLLAHLVAEPRDNPPDRSDERVDEIRDLMEGRE